MSIKYKLMAVFILLVSLLGLSLIVIIQTTFSWRLETELMKRGTSISRHFVSEITDHILTDNIFFVQMLSADLKESEENIEYVFVLDRNGNVIAHTFGENFPTDLLNANAVASGQTSNIQLLTSNRNTIMDIATNILEGETGLVRIGISEEPIRKEIMRLSKLMILITVLVLVVGSGIASVITIAITKPIRELEMAAEALAEGNLGHRVAVTTADEIGKLSNTFNEMAEYLQQTNRELEHSLSDKDMLIREVHHRVKNNLAVIQSLLKLQLRDVSDKESRDQLTDAKNRVKGMAMIHEMLHNAEDVRRLKASDYIRGFVKTLFLNYRVQERIKLKHEIQDITLDVDILMPLGLIINELVSNALKHAFPEGRTGELSISLKETAQGTYELIIRDTGSGMPEGFNIFSADSLGLQIVITLVSQLHGTLDVSSEGGTEFRITFTEEAIG